MARRLLIDGHPVHKAVTLDAVAAAVDRSLTSLDDPGFCVGCGIEVGGVEPDARRYICDACGCPTVYGAEELLIRFAL